MMNRFRLAPRRGFSLVEIMVAMAILGVAFTSIFAMQVRIMARQRRAAAQSARNAVLIAEVGRVESMWYDSLSLLLVTDTISTSPTPSSDRSDKSQTRFVRRFTITDNGATAPTCPTSFPCKDVRVKIVPLFTPSDSVVTVIRRSRTAAFNPLFLP